MKALATKTGSISFWARLFASSWLAVLLALVPFASAGEENHIETVSLVGTFQADLGCPYDWDPSCTQTSLQDADGDGVYEFSTRQLPRGTFECRVVINERWTESYGEAGDRDGGNIVFDVTEDRSVIIFTYDSHTHVLSMRESVAGAESETTPCQSNQECRDRLGSDWECASGLCVRIRVDDGDSTFFCGFSALLGNGHPALDLMRRLRDEVLGKYFVGRMLIDLYYRKQSAVFSFVGKHPKLQKFVVKLIESSVPMLEYFLERGEAISRARER